MSLKATSEEDKQVIIAWLKQHMGSVPNPNRDKGGIIASCNETGCSKSYQLKDDWTGFYNAVKHLETKHPEIKPPTNRPIGSKKKGKEAQQDRTSPQEEGATGKKAASAISNKRKEKEEVPGSCGSSSSSDESDWDDCDFASGIPAIKPQDPATKGRKQKKGLISAFFAAAKDEIVRATMPPGGHVDPKVEEFHSSTTSTSGATAAGKTVTTNSRKESDGKKKSPVPDASSSGTTSALVEKSSSAAIHDSSRSSGGGGGSPTTTIQLLQYNILEQFHRPRSLVKLLRAIAENFPLATLQEVCGNDLKSLELILEKSRGVANGSITKGVTKTSKKLADQLQHVKIVTTSAHHKGHNAILYDDRHWTSIVCPSAGQEDGAAALEVEYDLGKEDTAKGSEHTIPMALLESSSALGPSKQLKDGAGNPLTMAVGSYHTPGASASRSHRAKQNVKISAAWFGACQNLADGKNVNGEKRDSKLLPVDLKREKRELVFISIGDGNYQQISKGAMPEMMASVFTLCGGKNKEDTYLHLPSQQEFDDNAPLRALLPTEHCEKFIANPEVGCLCGVLSKAGKKDFGAAPVQAVSFSVVDSIMCSDHEPCLVTIQLS